ncbi:DUF3617 domain-containing protein [Azospira restricta]|uniref:DUF3617 family protein n=1 Tax=Azospira restricta TaxID=404405 RepID=A0A974SNK0_9RHOO|nr:DUF3617 family protein [Azospira restricta]QRJ63098.1 DUF3617 family protein [Azospira restricta]
MRRPALALCSLLLAAGVAAAAEAPARKSGLWEITNAMGEPMPMTQTMQQCIDEKTDKLTEQTGMREAQQRCSKNEIKREGNKVVSESVCNIEGTTATTRAEFTGDFSSNYKGTVKTTYSPPMQGMKGMQMNISARWLGPCQAGQKPGDVMMPGGMKFNAADMQRQMRQ